jgi:hypothetical protein
LNKKDGNDTLNPHLKSPLYFSDAVYHHIIPSWQQKIALGWLTKRLAENGYQNIYIQIRLEAGLLF